MPRKRTTKPAHTKKTSATIGAASQVVCTGGFKPAPPEDKIKPVLDVANEAARWIENFMPVVSRGDTKYRTKPTRANCYGWGHAMAAVRRVVDIATVKRLFYPQEGMVFIQGLSTQQNIAVACLCESATRIVVWADKCRESRKKKSDPLAPLPIDLATEFHEAVRVFCEEARDYPLVDEYSSKRYTPKELRKLFGRISQDTLLSRLDSQQIRNIKHSSKSYQIHLDDLPD